MEQTEVLATLTN